MDDETDIQTVQDEFSLENLLIISPDDMSYQKIRNELSVAGVNIKSAHVNSDVELVASAEKIKSTDETVRDLQAHRRCWGKIVNESLEHQLYLIVQTGSTFQPYFGDVLEYSLDTAPANFDILFMHGGLGRVPALAKLYNLFLTGLSSNAASLNSDWMVPHFIFDCSCYIISRKGAEKLLALTDRSIFHLPLSHMIHRWSNKGDLDVYAYKDGTVVQKKQVEEENAFPLLLLHPILEWCKSVNMEFYKGFISKPLFTLGTFNIDILTLYILSFSFLSALLGIFSGTTLTRIFSVLFIVDILNDKAKRTLSVMFLAKVVFYIGKALSFLI